MGAVGTNYYGVNGDVVNNSYIYQVQSNSISYGTSTVTSGSTTISTFTATGTVSGYSQLTFPGNVTLGANQSSAPGSLTVGADTYQVYGTTADGQYLVYGSAQGPSAGPLYVLTDTPMPPSGTLTFSSNNTVYTPPAPVCFRAGTMIATPRGEVAVEAIAVGDTVLTASGKTRPVVWVGSTRVHAGRRSHGADVNPVVISRGALADNIPARDLWVSPGHRILIDGALFQAIALVNGATITQRRVATIDYHHVELDAPDALIAEGVFAESFIDVGNRVAFGAAVGHPSAPAIIDADPETETFAPTIKHGPRLVAVREALLARALRSGWERRVDGDFHLEVDGRRLGAAARVGDRAWFIPGAPVSEVRIISAAAVCCAVKPVERDDRRLGIQVVGVTVDGRTLQLANPAFSDGFHDCETTEEDTHFRWTDGAARLRLRRPASVIEITIGRGAEIIARTADSFSGEALSA